jgi:hypothetical protein
MTTKNGSSGSKTIEQVHAATLADLKRIAEKAAATASAPQHGLLFPSRYPIVLAQLAHRHRNGLRITKS